MASALESRLFQLLHHVENRTVYLILLATGLTQKLEDPRYLDTFRTFLSGAVVESLRAVAPKDLNRYQTIQRMVTLLGDEFHATTAGFDYWRNWMLDQGVLAHQKEAGGGWQGFGGVHSHYYINRTGMLFFNLMTFFMVTPVVDFGTCVRRDRVNFYLVLDRIMEAPHEVTPRFRLHKDRASERTTHVLKALLEWFLSTEEVPVADVRRKASATHGTDIPKKRVRAVTRKLASLFVQDTDPLVLNEEGHDLIYLYYQLSQNVHTGA